MLLQGATSSETLSRGRLQLEALEEALADMEPEQLRKTMADAGWRYQRSPGRTTAEETIASWLRSMGWCVENDDLRDEPNDDE